MNILPIIAAAACGAALADGVSFDFAADAGAIKPLHGVNNAPVRANGSQDEFKAAGIPYVRTHDTAGAWGGAHYVDIPNVFPNFDADENDPASYDFAFTDAYLKPIADAGCQIFYRLGVTIENDWKIKAYNIYPPKDFAKWARICEHVVRHYNEGWADGFKWGIEYWEIWNEPENPPMWRGTREQFYEMYRVAANHLKTKFPHIKVGGYASCGFYVVDDPDKGRRSPLYREFVPWFTEFCKYVQAPETKAPLDFFSWHLYITGDTPVERIATHAAYVRKTLDDAGLEATENIFNEWNIFRIRGVDQWDVAKSHVGAANVAAAFCRMQTTSIDKAMYYDACPTRCYCGLFYYPSMKTTPCYEAFRAWNELAKLGSSVPARSGVDGVYAAAARNGAARAFLLANVGNKERRLDVAADGSRYTLYRVDERHAKLTADGAWSGGAVDVPGNGIVLALSGVELDAKPSSSSRDTSIDGVQSGAQAAVEESYDFRKRLEVVHEAGRRDPAAKPAADEFAFVDGAVVRMPADADEVMALAAKDFCDYLDVSMGVSARLARGGRGAVEIAIDGSLPPRTHRIETGNGVRITAADSRAAAQALYHLEDMMNFRRAPFLKRGVERRRSMFSPRMTHSGWAVDVFPDAHLAQMAHAGMDAIVIFVKDVDKTKGAVYQDVRDVIRRAKRYGLDTYLYSYVVAFVHPDDPGAKEKFESTYGRIAAAYPEAKGIVFVGESCQFPTKDERAQPRTWDNRIPGDNRPTAGWWPCRDYPDWVRAVKASIDAHSKGMEIVFWTYNWGKQPVQPRMELIDALPRDITLMATFEMFEPQVKRNGLNAPSADYSLSFEGPGRYFASEAERAHERGMKLYSMSNTGGLTWDFGVIPYQPCPFQWKRRYDGIVKAQRDWGLSGLMECHHYGWWPSFVSELEKETFTEGGIPFDQHIRMIAARDFGAENVERAIEAWKLWSDAARDYVASDDNQYGPFRMGPAYPYNFGGKWIANKEFPCPPYASFGVGIARLNYLDRNGYNPKAGQVTQVDVEKMNKELALLEDMREALGRGADIFDSIATEKARSMARLGRFMQRTVITAINVKHGAIAHCAGDKAAVLEWAKKEYANAKAALPLVEADSRLGWEPSMEYVGGPEQIRWKLDRMTQTYPDLAE